MKRRVALKVLRPELLASPEAARRFRREVEAVARLDHPNIVAAFDAGEADGTGFLVMQLVEGRDLSTVVSRGGPLSVRQAADYILQAAQGLVYAHQEGIIHRDIKPSNLLVDRSGVVKVLDLGLATLLAKEAGPDESLTKSHMIVGTPDYMAPEQARGLKNADARSDIYSLGLTLWYLLTGKVAYEAEGVMGKLLAHRSRPIPSLVEARPDIGPEVDAIFRRMVAKRPTDRYQSVCEVVDALETLKSGLKSITLPHPGQGEHNQRADAARPEISTPAAVRSRTRHARLGALCLGVATLVALSAWGVWRLSTWMNSPSTEALVSRGDSEFEDDVPGKNGNLPPSDENPAAPLEYQREGWQGWPANAPSPAIAPFDAAQAKVHQDAWAKYLEVPAEWEGPYGIRFRLIPPGEFLMGSTGKEVKESLKGQPQGPDVNVIESSLPRHKVVLSQPFYLGICEVTQEQFEIVRGKNPSHHAPLGAGKDKVAKLNTDAHPVEGIRWTNAVCFCNELSQQCKLDASYASSPDFELSGQAKGFRLATEAEWEFACRAGTTTMFWWGDNVEERGKFEWLGEADLPSRSMLAEILLPSPRDHQHPVGKLAANPFGLFDMHGNVREWCHDWWQPYDRDRRTEIVNPGGPASGTERVMRGGAASADPNQKWQSSSRLNSPPDRAWINVGMRVVVSVEAVKSLVTQTVELPTIAQAKEEPESRPAHVSKSPDPQRRALETVLRLGGTASVTRQPSGNELLAVWPEDLPPESFTVGALSIAPHAELDTTVGLALDGLAFLPSLSLKGDQVSDETCRKFENCLSLRSLTLEGTEITDEGIRRIAAARSLRSLEISSMRVSDAACRELAKHAHLRELDLKSAELTDLGLKELASLRTLRTLNLNNNKAITKDGLAHLASLPSLQMLHVTDTAIDDQAVDVLASLSRLRIIDVRSTKLSSQGALRLKSALPAAIVFHDSLPQLEFEARVEKWVEDQRGTIRQWTTGRPNTPYAVSSVRFGDGAPVSGAARLVGLTSIESLIWPNLKSADSEVEAISKLTSLTFLNLTNSDLTEVGLSQLAALRQLEHLYLNGSSKLSGKSLTELVAFKNLQVLGLSNLSCTDAELGALAGLPSLAQVDLVSCPNVTSTGLAHLAGLPLLTTLDLRGTPIDDNAADFLGGARALRLLYLQDTKLTSAGIDKLKAALPKCLIFWSGGAVVPTVDLSLIAGKSRHYAWPADDPPPAIAPFDAAAAKRFQESWAKHLGVPAEWVGPYGIRFRLIPPGEFLMGSTQEEVSDILHGQIDASSKEVIESSLPRHKVVLSEPFYLSDCEITQAQFEALRGKNPSATAPAGALKAGVENLDTASFPVEAIKWTNAAATCNELSGLCGLEACYSSPPKFDQDRQANGFRLPTEAEWEFACRAGTTTQFWWGDSVEERSKFGWFGSGDHPQPVGSREANPFGLFDMPGNVVEWCQDWWKPYLVRRNEMVNPRGPAQGTYRVMRGGSYLSDTRKPWRSGARMQSPPDRTWNNVGMRMAVSVEGVKKLMARPEPLPDLARGGQPPKGPMKVSTSGDPQRRALETVFQLGGSAGIIYRQLGKDGGRIAWPEDLLDEPFEVWSLAIESRKDVDAEAAQALAEIAFMRSLRLSNTGVGDESVRQIAASHRLAYLWVDGTRISDVGVRHLADFGDLRDLDLSNTEISDAACAHLSKHAFLRQLVLRKTAITDLGLKEISPLQTLRSLDLNGNEAITKDGLAHLQSLPNLQFLDLSGTAIGDEAVEALALISQLRNVDVTGSKMTRDGALRLQAALPRATVFHPELPQLELESRAVQWVKVKKGAVGKWTSDVRAAPFAVSQVVFGAGGPRVGAANLVGLRSIDKLTWDNLLKADVEAESIGKLDSLTQLDLLNSDLSDAGLSHLKTLKQLESLHLTNAKITDAGMSHLVALQNLNLLNLNGLSCSDEGLVPLGKLPALRQLALNSFPRVTSQGLAHLVGLPNLTILDLENTPIDDGGVKHLKQMSLLRVLTLRKTRLTAAGIDELKAALPKCLITWDGGMIVPGATKVPASGPRK